MNSNITNIKSNVLTLTLKRKITYNTRYQSNKLYKTTNNAHIRTQYSIKDPMLIINLYLTLDDRISIMQTNHVWRNAILQPACWKTFTGNIDPILDHNHPIFKNKLFLNTMFPIWKRNIHNNNPNHNSLSSNHFTNRLYLSNKGHIINIFRHINRMDTILLLSNITEITIENNPISHKTINDNIYQVYDLEFERIVCHILYKTKSNLTSLNLKSSSASSFIFHQKILGQYIRENSDIVLSKLSSFTSNNISNIALIEKNNIKISNIYINDIKRGYIIHRSNNQLYYKNIVYHIGCCMLNYVITHLKIELTKTGIAPNLYILMQVKHERLSTLSMILVKQYHQYALRAIQYLTTNCVNLRNVNITFTGVIFNKMYLEQSIDEMRILCADKNVNLVLQY